MLLGARQFFERRGGGWQNPYVTDGLVAMWDGEWKNEAGVPALQLEHEYWADIVGGHNIPLTNTNGKVFPNWADYGEKFIDFNTDEYTTLADRIQIGTVSSEEVTFELVIAFSRGGSGSFNARNTIYCENGGKYMLPYDASSYYTPTSRGGFSSHGFTAFTLDGTSPSAVSFSLKSGVQTMLVNGTAIASSNSTWSGVGKLSQFGLCSYNADRGRCWNKFFCIRLYSRALTAAEIAANYAIDQARFNLP